MNTSTRPDEAYKTSPFTGLESEQKPHPNANIYLYYDRPLAPELRIDGNCTGADFPFDNDVRRFLRRNTHLRLQVDAFMASRNTILERYKYYTSRNKQLRNMSFEEECNYPNFDFRGTDFNQDPNYQKEFLLNEMFCMLREIRVLQRDNSRLEDLVENLERGWDQIMETEIEN